MDSQPSLSQRLCADDESDRAFAAEDAGYDDHAEDIEPLVARMRAEPSRFVREAIVTALGRMTHGAACDAVLPLLESDDAFLRSAAVTVLQSHPDDAGRTLSRAWAGADQDVRKFLLDAASALRGDDVEAVLLRGLDDPDVNVRIAAVEHLGERAHPSLKVRFEALVRDAEEPMLISTALTALEAVGDASSWDVVAHRYADPTGFPSFLAPQLLRLTAKWAPPSVVGGYLEAARSLGPSVLGDWIDGLESLQDRFGFRTISPAQFGLLCDLAASSPSPLCRMRILKWMGRLDQQPEVLRVLTASLESPDPMSRHGAALGLSQLGSDEARRALAARLSAEGAADVRATIEEGVRRAPETSS